MLNEMNIRLSKIDNGIDWLFFLLSPLVSIPILIWGVLKGKKNNLVLISLAMALIGFVFPPFADLYRHTKDYLYWVDHGKDGFLLMKGQIDFLFYSMSNIFAKNHIPFEYIRSVFVFICYQISFFLYRKSVEIKNVDWDSQEAQCLFWIFFLSVPFIWIVNGLRMATACYIAILGWYYYYNRNLAFGLLFYILSLTLHFGALMFFPLFLCINIPALKFSRIQVVMLSVLILGLGGILLKLLPASLIEQLNMEKNVDLYMNRSQKEFGDTMSFNGFIAMWLERIMIVYVFYYLIREWKMINFKDSFLIVVCFFAWFMVLPFTILFQKLSLFIIPIILYLIIKNSSDIFFLKKIKLCCIISFCAYVYGYRAPLMHTPIYKLLVSPAYVMMNVNTKTTFENSKANY